MNILHVQSLLSSIISNCNSNSDVDRYNDSVVIMIEIIFWAESVKELGLSFGSIDLNEII